MISSMGLKTIGQAPSCADQRMVLGLSVKGTITSMVDGS